MLLIFNNFSMEIFLVVLSIIFVVIAYIYSKKSKQLTEKDGEIILPIDILKKDVINYKNNNDTLLNTENLIKTNLTKIKKNVEIRDSKARLTGCNWLLLDEQENLIYSFKNNNEIIINNDNLVLKGNYEIIVDNNSLLITKNDIIENYEFILHLNEMLFLKKFFHDEILIFVNYTKYKDEMKSEIKKQAKQIYKTLTNDRI